MSNYWDALIKEIASKRRQRRQKQLGQVLDENLCDGSHDYQDYKPKERSKLKFHIHENFIQSYLTAREAECIYFLMQGNTMKQVARVLNLSHRTVEFYLNNVKDKMGMRKKTEVLAAIASTDFIQCFENSILYQPSLKDQCKH